MSTAEYFEGIIPPGSKPGHELLATMPSGRKVKVTLPPGAKPGQELSFHTCQVGTEHRPKVQTPKPTELHPSDPKAAFDLIPSSRIIRLGILATDAAFHAREIALMEIIVSFFASDADDTVVLSLPINITGNLPIWCVNLARRNTTGLKFVVHRADLSPNRLWMKATTFLHEHGGVYENEKALTNAITTLYNCATKHLLKIGETRGQLETWCHGLDTSAAISPVLSFNDVRYETKHHTAAEEKSSKEKISDVIVEGTIYLVSSEGHEFAVDKRIAASSLLLKQMLGMLGKGELEGPEFAMYACDDEDGDEDEDEDEDDDDDDDGDDKKIPLPIETATLEAIVRFCNYHLENGELAINLEQPDDWSNEYELVSTWDADFINEMYDSGTLAILVETAFYLRISSLIMLVGIKLESMMRMNPDLRDKLWKTNGMGFELQEEKGNTSMPLQTRRMYELGQF